LKNLVNKSKPDRRAAQQQRVWQQIQIQIAIHDGKVTITPGGVKWFFGRQPAINLFAMRGKSVIHRPSRFERASKA
jgi:hypothetical protein